MFSNADLEQIRDHGLTVDEVNRQIGLFRNPPPHTQLDRSCTVGDGILRLSNGEVREALSAYELARDQGRILKMVPASGAASRMFQALLYAKSEWPGLTRQEIAAHAGDNDKARLVLAFMDGFERFAFVEDLCASMRRGGLDARALAGRGDFADILDHLLTTRGLDYAARPKGLIKFHAYPGGNRTPMEEHLVDAAQYTRDAEGICRLHFTVSEEHREGFAEHLDDVRRKWEGRFGVRYEVGFSTQQSSTDTIAVDLDNEPFRTSEDRLLFRPGGHGALIGNVSDLQADIVHLSNVDNVAPDRLKPEILHWRCVLTGHLANVQGQVFDRIRQLSESPHDDSVLDDAMQFAGNDLGLSLPEGIRIASKEQQRAFLLARLDRPMRVCGMVPNAGEPGGGPFWVRSNNESTRQIVEGAQVDPDCESQAKIYALATHFNPPDVVAAVRNWQGRCFDLRTYVDPRAVFISGKSHEGRSLKALEHPGLWNGAMANWTTIFVEVPGTTFNPAKTVIDLLRPQHQPA